MVKQKKKRTKKYSGADARVGTPVVTRVSAEELSAFTEWWRTYERIVRLVAIVVGTLIVLLLCVVGIIGLIGG